MGFRILIVGSPGSGKTTLAAQLSHSLGIPHIEADAFFWLPEGNPLSPEALASQVAGALSKTPDWVFEGHLKTCSPVVLPHATHIIEIQERACVSLLRYLRRELASSSWRKWKKISYGLFNHRRLLKYRRAVLAGATQPILRVDRRCLLAPNPVLISKELLQRGSFSLAPNKTETRLMPSPHGPNAKPK